MGDVEMSKHLLYNAYMNPKKKNESSAAKRNLSQTNSVDHEALLNTEPKILFDHNRQLVLMWSPKVGCTFLCKWFFAQMNLLDAALYYNNWVHRFRQDVYYRSEGYVENIHKVLNGDFTVIKVVRNPFARAVSSYITALFQALNKPGMPIYEKMKKELEGFFHRPLIENELFSFREYISYLENIDILTCEAHHRQQMHPLEIEKLLIPTHIVELEKSEAELKKIEKGLNLKSIDLHTLKQSQHHTKREAQPEFCGDVRFDWAPNLKFPTYRSFYDDDLVRKTAGIYKMDFAAYGFSTDISPGSS